MGPIKAHEPSHSGAMTRFMPCHPVAEWAYVTLKTAGHGLFRGSLASWVALAHGSDYRCWGYPSTALGEQRDCCVGWSADP